MNSRDLVISSKEREARENQEHTILLIEKTVENFLEIGRLLKECYDKKYWQLLGYKNFREYVEYLNIPSSSSYCMATRLIGIYEMSMNPLAPSREEFIKIGVSKLTRILPTLRKGTFTKALLDKARTLSDMELRHEVGHNVSKSKSVLSKELETEDLHRDIQNKIEEMGTIFGKYSKREYQTSLYRYDVVWKEAERVTHVFEIQAGGDVDKAMNKLVDAYDHLGKPQLLLVVATKEDRDRAERLLFDSVKKEVVSSILLVYPEQLYEIYRSLIHNPEVFKKLFTK
jgi:hypothetical protein